LSAGDVDLRTLYSFRERLSRYMQETGVNLLDQAFAQGTDAHIHAFSRKTGNQRMDSTLLASNIRRMGRVHLLVTVLQRVHRMVGEADQRRDAELLAPDLKGHAGQYVYRLKTEDLAEQLQRIGTDMRRLVRALEAEDHTHPTYAVPARVGVEHCRVVAERLEGKKGDELSASRPQSPDDLEAAYRAKHGQRVPGFSAHLSQPGDPDNPVQLMTHPHVAPANTDDPQVLLEAAPRLQARTGLRAAITDGASANEQPDALLHALGITHIQTALRGRTPDEHRLGLHDFAGACAADCQPQQMTCPNGHTVEGTHSAEQASFLARFLQATCQSCPLRETCPVTPYKQQPDTRLRFDQAALRRAQRRKIAQADCPLGHHLRAAIEAIVRSVRHPFPAGTLPVRGVFRAAGMVIGSATMSTMRPMHRYLLAQQKAEWPGGPKEQSSRQAENALAPATDMIGSLFRCFFLAPERRSISCFSW